jgi:hydrogenase-4 component F
MPLLALALVASLLVGFGALMLRLSAIAFGEPSPGGTAVATSTVPMFVHLALVLMAGVYLPPPIVAWFQTVAEMLG